MGNSENNPGELLPEIFTGIPVFSSPEVEASKVTSSKGIHFVLLRDNISSNFASLARKVYSKVNII